MKMKQLLLIGLLMGAICSLNAQSYKSAVGVKAGNVLLGTFKTFLGEKLAFEGVAGFGLETNTDFYAAAYVQLHFPITSVDNLTWFAGAGPNIGTGFGNNTNIGITGIGGADYRFGDLPLNVSADISTPIFFGDSVYNFVPFFSASARYIFGE